MTSASSFLLALALTAGATVAPPVGAQAAGPQPTVNPARSPDAAFVAKAADVLTVETDLAALAVTRASAADVKAVAKQVLDTRTAMARDLAALAGTRQMPGAPHSAADPPAPTPASTLRATPALAFDAAFLAALLANGEAAVALFDAESRDGRDDEIKEWAARQLPALREHLTAIRRLRPRPGS